MATKRWMLFVDGENLTNSAQRLATARGKNLADPSLSRVYRQNTVFWPKTWLPRVHPFASDYDNELIAERAYYYTCIIGDDVALKELRKELHTIGFNPLLFKKSKGAPAKRVDVTLTKDMLVQSHLNNYDIAVLISGDADFVPVVEEVKSMGRQVVVSFFREEYGLSIELRLAADRYRPFDLLPDKDEFHLTRE